MKIGILTLPLHTNYGGLLQAYALMTVLKKKGHDVWLIDRRPNRIAKWKYPLAITKRLIYKYLLRKKNIIIFKEQKKAEEYPIISQNIAPFIEEYITPSTKPIENTKEFHFALEENFDAYIVGSDQVWRPEYTPEIENYFFDFLDSSYEGKRIAYAASFGVSDWAFSALETKNCSSLIKRFTGISVREDDGVRICKEHLKVEAVQVLDPTMLLDKSDYEALIGANDPEISDKKGLLTYLLDMSDDKRRVVDKISAHFSYSSFPINNGNVEKVFLPAKDRIAPSVEQWLEGFRDAQYIITDSFHACVYSILFNKPFVVYGNKERGMTRFHSLLKLFGLENRLITSYDEINETILESNINWDEINILIKKYRMESNEFIDSCLNPNA